MRHIRSLEHSVETEAVGLCFSPEVHELGRYVYMRHLGLNGLSLTDRSAISQSARADEIDTPSPSRPFDIHVVVFLARQSPQSLIMFESRERTAAARGKPVRMGTDCNQRYTPVLSLL